MEPIPETIEAIDEFGPFGDGDLLADLMTMGGRVRELVPDCVGLSVTQGGPDVTFTLVAPEDVLAELETRHCPDAGVRAPAVDADLLAEDRWRTERGDSAAGVAGSLTLPIVAMDVVVGSVDLYAASPDAFVGKHDEVAAIFGAWAPGAVLNADLAFDTKRVAEAAPKLLLDETRIQIAVGILASSLQVSAEHAHARLRDAALKADVSEGGLAKILIEQATLAHPPVDE